MVCFSYGGGGVQFKQERVFSDPLTRSAAFEVSAFDMTFKTTIKDLGGLFKASDQ